MLILQFHIVLPEQKQRLTVLARDIAGNETRLSLPCMIKEKKFRSDKMNLSETFLQQKMPEFQTMLLPCRAKRHWKYLNMLILKCVMTTSGLFNPSVKNQHQKCSGKVLFYVCVTPRQWLFLVIEEVIWLMGRILLILFMSVLTLASVAHAAIEAANTGIVVFAGPLGIYGNAIIIDHGLGIFSLYGHLSSIDTAVGKIVKKEEVIGHSGTSGLAGGDHLHFSIIVGGQFVNPQEWWDAHWIEDNINKKMGI